jgi:hypothetical protein
MEPFGLLQFLQSLLKNPPSDPPPTEELPQEIPKEKPNKPDPAPTNDAYLQFITNHDKRAHGVRKK